MFTGLREGEILGLTWDCVDFEEGTIKVKHQLRREQKKGGIYYISSPKNGKARIISPAPTVMQLFKDQQFRQLEQRFKAGDAWVDKVRLFTASVEAEKEYDLVFRNDTGGLLSYRTVYDCFKRIVKKIGAPEARLHDLRHTYSVNSLKAGDDIKTLQENLGHATAAFTMQVYGHVTDEMKRASAERMEQYIKSISGL